MEELSEKTKIPLVWLFSVGFAIVGGAGWATSIEVRTAENTRQIQQIVDANDKTLSVMQDMRETLVEIKTELKNLKRERNGADGR